MASAATELGRIDEARRLLNKARTDDPDEPRIGYVAAHLALIDPRGDSEPA
jgi:hypothetical protein